MTSFLNYTIMSDSVSFNATINQAPCSYRVTYSLVSGSQFATLKQNSFTGNQNLVVYTTDQTLFGDQTIEIEAILDDRAETSKTFSISAYLEPCKCDLFINGLAIRYDYIVGDPAM